MKKTRNKAQHRSIALALIAVIVIGAIFAAAQFYKPNNSTPNPSTNNPASSSNNETNPTIRKAMEAHEQGNYDAAKSLYQQARSEYEASNNATQVAEIDSLISLIEVEQKSKSNTEHPPIAGQN